MDQANISELKQVTFLTTRTSTGSKVDVFHQSQPLTQSSDVTHAVRVVKNVTCLNSLLARFTARVLLRPALALASRFSRMLSFQIKDMEFTADKLPTTDQ
jgi:hypothetical protein